jgi:hypothetical protein
LASLQRKSIGEVISELTRQALRPNTQSVKFRNGVPILPVRTEATAVTPELVNQLRDEFFQVDNSQQGFPLPLSLYQINNR